MERNFIYYSEADKKIEDLRQIASNKDFTNNFYEYINRLEKEIVSEEEKEFEKAKDEIKRSIETEINKMIITESQQIEATFDNDLQLQKAIEIIKDLATYKKILGK